MSNRTESLQGVGLKPVKYLVPFTHYTAKFLLQDMRIRSGQTVKIARDGGRKETLLTCKRTEQKGWKTERIPSQEL
jgi:hypothetical protein